MRKKIEENFSEYFFQTISRFRQGFIYNIRTTSNIKKKGLFFKKRRFKISPTHIQTSKPKVLQKNKSLLIFHKGRFKRQMHFLYRLGPEHVLLVFKFKNSEKNCQPSHLDSVIDSAIQFTN